MKSVEIIIDNAWDPRNYNAIINTCLGFSIHQIYLYHSYNEYPPLPKLKDLNVTEIYDLQAFVQQKKQQDYCFIAADFHDKASIIYDFDFPQHSMLVFGAERLGISDELKALCDETVYIPMAGLVKSYNISVSVGIFCYQIYKTNLFGNQT